MSTFHHAYNGIPALRSSEPFFKDDEPAPLDHLAPDTYSGTLKLTIETKTPLITAWRDSNGRLVMPSASGNPEGANSDKDVIIPATSLKGVLSSAYEEVTCSRFRVFGDDQRQAQFRYTTDHPGMWKRDKTTPWKTGFLRVTHSDNGPQWTIHFQQCALLPDSINAGVDFTPPDSKQLIPGGFKMEEQRDKDGNVKRDENNRPIIKKTKYHRTPEQKQAVNKILESLRRETPHLSRVKSFKAFEQKSPDRTKLIVSQIEDTSICTSKRPERKPELIECNGYVVRLTTVPKSGILTDDDRLISTKYNEYIFYTDKGTPKGRDIDLDINSAFVAIVLEAARIASSSDTNKGARHTLINKAIHHIEQKAREEELHKKLTRESIYEFLLDEAGHEPGIPVFARKCPNGEWELAFSQLGRSATPGSLSPSRLAEIRGVTPVRSIAEASAADRLWGFVAQDPDNNVSPALKGRIYLTNPRLQPQEGSAYLSSTNAGTGWIPSVLAGPKPWTAQPYLRRKDGAGIFKTERSKCFTDQHALIRKTYPTHRFLLPSGGSSVLDRKGTRSQLSRSELLIGSYVKAGAIFESTLRFEGLSAQELSVILWLLDPEKIVPKAQRAAGELGFFHLGLGKPLGLGAVCIRAEVLTLVTSRLLASNYRELKGVLALDKTTRSNEEQKSLDAQLASVNEALPSTIFEQTSLAVRAFVRSAYGWKSDEREKDDPVSYSPYRSTSRISPIIDYFTKYEKSRIRGEEFTPRMPTLEEDNEPSTSGAQVTTAPKTPVQPSSSSQDSPMASSESEPKKPSPVPQPGLYRVSSR